MLPDRERLERDGCLLISATVSAPAIAALANAIGGMRAGARLPVSLPAGLRWAE